jgi:hypothetical protein
MAPQSRARCDAMLHFKPDANLTGARLWVRCHRSSWLKCCKSATIGLLMDASLATIWWRNCRDRLNSGTRRTANHPSLRRHARLLPGLVAVAGIFAIYISREQDFASLAVAMSSPGGLDRSFTQCRRGAAIRRGDATEGAVQCVCLPGACGVSWHSRSARRYVCGKLATLMVFL